MFITGGRAGQVAFFVMLAIIIFQFFNTAKVKSLLIVLMLIPGIFFTAYHTSDLFQQRVDDSISEVLDYSKCCSSSYQNTSLGQRITFTINSWEVFKQNPIIGIGTGDFPSEYRKINQANTPSIRNTTNPHNMYILVLTQLGLIGLVSMLGIFYYQIKLSFRSKDRFFRDFGITLPLLFLVMMLSDSYLLGHYTTLMYIFFSAFLYKDFEKS